MQINFNGFDCNKLPVSRSFKKYYSLSEKLGGTNFESDGVIEQQLQTRVLLVRDFFLRKRVSFIEKTKKQTNKTNKNTVKRSEKDKSWKVFHAKYKIFTHFWHNLQNFDSCQKESFGEKLSKISCKSLIKKLFGESKSKKRVNEWEGVLKVVKVSDHPCHQFERFPPK